MRQIYVLCLVVGLGMGTSGDSTAATLAPDEPIAIAILHQDLREVLQDFSVRIGLPIGVAPNVTGVVRDIKGSYSTRAFLDKLSRAHELTWYFDGDMIHIAPIAANRTLLIELGQGDLDTLTQGLRDLDIDDARYPIRRTPNARVARLSGPPALVSLVEETLRVLPAPPAAQSAPVQQVSAAPVSRPRFCIGC